MFDTKTYNMDKAFALLVLLANLMVLQCQEEELIEEKVEYPTSTGNPNYSFSYGVSDVQTGDMKAVWEEKEGDTVKGHYSVLEPDGTMRTVEYSASPETGFTAVVNNDGEKVEHQSVARSSIEGKSLRDYSKFYDFSEDSEFDSYMTNERKRSKHPFDTVFKDYSAKKRPKHPSDLESSDFSHSISIKHPRDSSGAESESHSHFGLDIDPHCKNKHKNPHSSKLYTNVVEFDPSKPTDFRYPFFPPESYKENFEKYEPSNTDYERLVSPYGSKIPKYEPSILDYEKFNPYSKLPKPEDFNFKPSKYKYPYFPDLPTSDFYPDEIPPRPKKKYRPHKTPEFPYPSEDLEDYWVPKKKKKAPLRVVEPEYPLDPDEEYDRPRYPSDFEDDDRPSRDREPPRGTGPKKEVIRKVIKKRKPAFNLLDILDI